MSEPVVVVGGGWAGLAAAVELQRLGRRVTLVEATRTLGGRARDVAAPFATVDNGQHLLIGAYRSVLELVDRLDLFEQELFVRRPMTLHMSDLAGDEVVLAVSSLPAPLHLAKALTSARGLGLRDRLAAVAFTTWLQRRGFAVDDTPLGALLAARGQPRRLVRALWEPLCLATLNTPLAEASARLFACVLERTFTGDRRNCDLLLPRCTLGTLLPERAGRRIAGRGGRVLIGRRAVTVESDAGGVAGVRLADGAWLAARRVVVATPPAASARLLAGIAPLAATLRGLQRFTYQPIATVYLRYPAPVRIAGGLRGVLGGTTQWLLDRRDCGQPGLVAAVISTDGPHAALDRAALAERVAGEAARVFPDWPPPAESYVIREKRATIASHAGVDALRPLTRSPLPGCWFAGDWTATGLPATLEGAVASGLESARDIAATTA